MPFRTFALCSVVLLLVAASARADGPGFRLEATGFPVPVTHDGALDGTIEASAVEPIGDGLRFLVAHDKAPELLVVEAATGRRLGAVSSPRFPAPALNPKWEGMAADPYGNFYVIGAHVGKTDEERETKSVLLTFRLNDNDAKVPTVDDASVIRWHVARPIETALRAEGLDGANLAKRKVEGLTYREVRAAGKTRRELVIGLREPGDKVRAYAADVTGASRDSELTLSPVFAFEAGSREGVASQLTSLEHVPSLDGFLVVTATEDADNAFHGNTLWFVADGGTTARPVAVFEVGMKAEGLAVLASSRENGRTAVRLLVAYDNDPHVTKIPSRFQTFTLFHEPQ